jgi:hypothetical protein
MEESLSKLSKKELIDVIVHLNNIDSNKDLIQNYINTMIKKKGNDNINDDNSNHNKKKEKRQFDMSKYRQRHIALQVQYDGINYIGFASQSGILLLIINIISMIIIYL